MVTITSFDQDASKVIIPGRVDYKGKSYPVSKIDTYISGCNYSTISLIIEDGVKEIENFCFIEFRKLEHVVLPNSLTKIGKNSFANVNDIAFFEASKTICSIINRNANNVANSVWAQNTKTTLVNEQPATVKDTKTSPKVHKSPKIHNE